MENYFRDLIYWKKIKTTTPQQVMFLGKLSTSIIFKLCKFNTKSVDIVLCILQKVAKPLRYLN